MKTKNSQINLWSTLVQAVDAIQDKAIGAKTSESLVTLLLEVEELPVDKDNIAIVYQNYGAEKPEFWAVGRQIRKRKIDPESYRTLEISDEPKADFASDHPLITQVINSGERIHLKSNLACINAGLPEGYQSFLVVPMTIREGRTLGAFILFSKEEGEAFTEEFAEVMDVLSNRFAYFIRHNVRRRRNAAFQYIQNRLYGKRYDRECALLDDFVKGLAHWFEHDKVEILIKHPLDTGSYTRACCVEEKNDEGDRVEIHSIKDFRLKPVIKNDELDRLFGDTLEDIGNQPRVLNTESEIRSHGITLPCKSWLAVPMRLMKGVNIGYLILYNEKVEDAFGADEDKLLDNLSDAVAMMIGNLRADHFLEAQREIKESQVDDNDDESFIDSLCAKAAESLKELYGVQELTILRYRHSDAGLQKIFNSSPTFDEVFASPAAEKQGFSRWIPDPDLIHEIGTNKETDAHWVRVYFSTLKAAMMDIMLSSRESNTSFHRKTLHVCDEAGDVVYFVAPMRSDTHSTGCYLFPASHIGDFTSQAIDDLADTFGVLLSDYEDKKRNNVLTEYGEKVALESSNDIEKLLNSAKYFISKVMYTKHLYIALYDSNKNEIHFALALHDGEPWEDVHGTRRELDNEKLGKTEEIILTGKSILHYTRAESERWYREPGHKEHAGDALASWLGVPIFSENGVIGVIATYHESLDYIFSEEDKFFLQQISGDVAGMLKALELVDKQTVIAEQQHILSSTLLSHDLTHRLNNSIGAISININQALRDIQEAQRSGNMSHFSFTKEALEDAELVLSELLVDLKEISDEEPSNIDLRELLGKVIPQIETSKKLLNNNIAIHKKALDSYPFSVLAHKRTLFNSIHSVISNAADALISKPSSGIDADGLYLDVELKSYGDTVNIVVTDNGKPLTLEESKTVFEFGVSGKSSSGFGLWRAKQVFKSVGGDIKLSESLLPETKQFIISLPISEPQKKSKMAIVVDDERSWRNILLRWLREESYEVELAANTDEALQIFESYKGYDENQPEYIFLDVALDKNEGTNVDGLSLISISRELFPLSKIIVVTGYASLSEAYKGDYDHLIQKVDEGGNVLTSEKFFSSLSNAKINYLDY